MLQGISITDASYPMLAECCTAYEAYRTQRNAIEAIYDEYAEYIYFTIRGGKREGKFRSGRLPLATSLPAVQRRHHVTCMHTQEGFGEAETAKYVNFNAVTLEELHVAPH